MLEKIKNIVLITFTLSLVASYFAIFGYYSFFNIDIVSFLKIEDLILIYARWVWIILLVFGLILYPMHSLFSKEVNENGWWDQKLFTIKGINYKRRAAILFPAAILIIVLCFIYKGLFDMLAIGTGIIFAGVILVSVVYMFYSSIAIAKGLNEIKIRDWAGMISITLFFIWILPLTSSVVIASKAQYDNVIVVLENDTINTKITSDLKYIGKTSDYFFINDNLTKTTTAFRMDKVKSFKVITNKTK